jgi:uroporphyrinogen decarboxylase
MTLAASGISPQKTQKTLLAALSGQALSTSPIWLMRQAGRYLPEYRALRQKAKNFVEFCLTPELAIEATLQPIRRFGFDAAILFSDILIIPHGLGQDVSFREGEGPVLEPVRNAADFSRLSLDRVAERTEKVMATVRGARQALPSQTALIGFAGSPWTVATYMVEGGASKDYAHTKLWSYRDRAGFQNLIDLLVKATILYLDAQIRAGAEVVQLFDSWAGVLSEADFARWVIAPNKAIIAGLKQDHPDIPIIAFPRGAGLYYPAFAEAVGADAIGLDTTVPVAWAKQNLQPRWTVQGNLDPLILCAGGTLLDDEIARIRKTLSDGPFIFNLGHGIVPSTPPDNVARLIELLRA